MRPWCVRRPGGKQEADEANKKAEEEAQRKADQAQSGAVLMRC